MSGPYPSPPPTPPPYPTPPPTPFKRCHLDPGFYEDSGMDETFVIDRVRQVDGIGMSISRRTSVVFAVELIVDRSFKHAE